MSLIQMSIAGAVMIVVIVLIRTLAINRLPKTTFIALWTVALTRLLIPVSVPSIFSVYSLFRTSTSLPAAEENEVITFSPGAISGEVQAVNTQITEAASEVSAFDPAFVWIIGAVITVVAFSAAYFVSFRNLRKAEEISAPCVDRWLDRHRIRRTVTVRSCAHISSPLTYGLFKPVIVLPENMNLDNPERLDYVLSHELTHIRRFDALRKLAVIAAVCLHWFNPLVWVMFTIFNRDIELACDEAVVFKAGSGSRKAYAMALIDMEEKRSVTGTLYTCFNKNAIEERIVAIMKIKRPTFVRLAVSAAIVVAVCLCFATTAYADQNKDNADTPVVSSADIDESIGSAGNISSSEPGAEFGFEVSPEESIETEPETSPETDPVVLDEFGFEVTPEADHEESTEVAAEKVTESAPEESAGHGIVWPVNSERITRAFGPSSNPDRGSSDHITIACDRGDAVVSAISGKVTEAAFVPEYGNYVAVCGEGDIRTLYAHLDDISVSVGQTIAAGDRIGSVGATGMVTGPCLAFYVYLGDQAVDPLGFYE